MLRKPRTYFLFGISLLFVGCTNAIPKFIVDSGSDKPAHVIQRGSARHNLSTTNYRLKGSFHFAAEQSSVLTTSNYKMRGAVTREGGTQ